MKKLSLLLAVLLIAGLAFVSCELEIREPWVPPVSATLKVGLGGENTLNVSSVKINGVAQAGLSNEALRPSAWNAISEFITVELEAGDYVEYTFTQPTQGANAWESWAIALYDENNLGNFIRADLWLNASSDAGFTSGKWSTGGVTSGGVLADGETYQTVGMSLPTDATVVVKVTFDGDNDVVTETVNGTLVQTIDSANW